MTLRWRTVIAGTTLALLASCAGGNKLEKQRMDCAERLTKAIQMYQKKKYASVVYRLEDTRIQCNGSPVMDTVLYYLGMANFNDRKFIEARTEFQRLVQDFPGSVFFDEAKFRIALAVFKQGHPSDRDQKETRESIRLFDDLLESYPHSAYLDSVKYWRTEAFEKMAKKEFDNAAFYVRAKEPESAVVYYKTFLGQYAGSRLADQARFTIVELLVKLNRTSEAVEQYTDFLQTGKDKELIKAAGALTARYRKAAGTTPAE